MTSATNGRSIGRRQTGFIIVAAIVVVVVRTAVPIAALALVLPREVRVEGRAERVLAWPFTEKSGRVLEISGMVDILDLKLGDCISQPASAEISEDLESVRRVRCRTPHDLQVAATYELPRRGLDDESAIVLQSYLGCREEVADFLAAPPSSTPLGVDFYYPRPRQVEAGDRLVTCLVFDGRGGRLDRSVAGVGADPSFVSFLGMATGDCLVYVEEYLMGADRASCTELHDAEVFSVYDLPGTAWPGQEAATEAVDQECRARYQHAAASNPDLAALTYDFAVPLDREWEAGDPQACVVTDFAGPTAGAVTAR